MVLTRRGILRAALVLLALLTLAALVFLCAAGEALLIRRYAPELAEDPEFWRSQQLLYTLSAGGSAGEGAGEAAVSAVFAGLAGASAAEEVSVILP